MAIVTERGTFPLSASRNECGRAGDENALSSQIVFLPLTWPILKEMPAICESARSPSANNNSRETLFRMEIRTGCCEQRDARKHEEHFTFEVRLSRHRGDGNLYRDSYKNVPSEEILFRSIAQRVVRKQLSLNTQKCLDMKYACFAGKRC